MAENIQHRTAISVEYLSDPREDFRLARVGHRMSWASDRKTTRKEDAAYCLFGLFDINMPLLYGEGERAFRRLQEEIIRTFEDDSIFAWSPYDSIPTLSKDWMEISKLDDYHYSPLARSPAYFRCLKHQILPHIRKTEKTWELRTGSLRIRMPVYRYQEKGSKAIILLNGVLWKDINRGLAIKIRRLNPHTSDYAHLGLYIVDWDSSVAARYDTLHIREPNPFRELENINNVNWVQVDYLLIKVAAGLEDRVVSVCYLSWSYGEDGSITQSVTAYPTKGWFRMGVQIRSENDEYVLIADKRDMAWALWLSKDWLCQPVTTHILQKPTDSTLEYVIHLPYSSIQSYKRGHLARTARHEDVCSVGSFLHLIHIEDTMPSTGSAHEIDIPTLLPWDDLNGGIFKIFHPTYIYVYLFSSLYFIVGSAVKSTGWAILFVLCAPSCSTMLVVDLSGLTLLEYLPIPLRHMVLYVNGINLRSLLKWARCHTAFIFSVWRLYALTWGFIHLGLELGGVQSNVSFTAVLLFFRAVGALISVKFPEISIRDRMLFNHYVTQPVYILSHPRTWTKGSDTVIVFSFAQALAVSISICDPSQELLRSGPVQLWVRLSLLCIFFALWVQLITGEYWDRKVLRVQSGESRKARADRE